MIPFACGSGRRWRRSAGLRCQSGYWAVLDCDGGKISRCRKPGKQSIAENHNKTEEIPHRYCLRSAETKLSKECDVFDSAHLAESAVGEESRSQALPQHSEMRYYPQQSLAASVAASEECAKAWSSPVIWGPQRQRYAELYQKCCD